MTISKALIIACQCMILIFDEIEVKLDLEWQNGLGAFE